MTSAMRRSAWLVPALLLALTPGASASDTSSACHHGDQYVNTLTITLPAAPDTVRPGSTLRVPVTVSRAAVPAGGVAVSLRLKHGAGASVYGSGETTIDGRVTLAAVVPRDARGPLHATVEALSPLATVPCYGTVHEHGLVESAWGRVTS
jgi:hypothetical protein